MEELNLASEHKIRGRSLGKKIEVDYCFRATSTNRLSGASSAKMRRQSSSLSLFVERMFSAESTWSDPAPGKTRRG